MLQRGKVQQKEKGKALKKSSDFLTDEEDGYTQKERDRISAELSGLYSKQKAASVLDILLDIQHRLANMETLLKAKKVRKAS